MDARATRVIQVLELLVTHDVEFVVIGGVAAVLAGSPIPTMDLDIVFRKTPENVPRLLAVLTKINAHYRDPAGRYIVPDESKLETMRMHLFETDLGDFDVLATVADDLKYVDLVDRTVEYEIGGFSVQALNVGALIETKEYANRPKDQSTLMFLRQIRDIQEPSD